MRLAFTSLISTVQVRGNSFTATFESNTCWWLSGVPLPEAQVDGSRGAGVHGQDESQSDEDEVRK